MPEEKMVVIYDTHFSIKNLSSCTYDIPKEDINTPGKLLGVLMHLLEKEWFAPSTLRELSFVVGKENGFNPYQVK